MVVGCGVLYVDCRLLTAIVGCWLFVGWCWLMCCLCVVCVLFMLLVLSVLWLACLGGGFIVIGGVWCWCVLCCVVCCYVVLFDVVR